MNAFSINIVTNNYNTHNAINCTKINNILLKMLNVPVLKS